MPVKAKFRNCIFCRKPAPTDRFRSIIHGFLHSVTDFPVAAFTVLCVNNPAQNHRSKFFGVRQTFPEILTDGLPLAFTPTFDNSILLHNFLNNLKFYK